jgi:hypothetical protein
MTLAWVTVDELVEAVLSSRVADGPLGLAVMAYRLRKGHPPPPL